MATYDNDGFIIELDKDEIFCFGSNTSGQHLGGAAKTALEKFGAIMGQSAGLQGKSYAIPTVGLVTLDMIQADVRGFLDFAEKHPYLTFLVTKIGTGIAGWPEQDIKKMFSSVPSNVVKPGGW